LVRGRLLGRGTFENKKGARRKGTYRRSACEHRPQEEHQDGKEVELQ